MPMELLSIRHLGVLLWVFLLISTSTVVSDRRVSVEDLTKNDLNHKVELAESIYDAMKTHEYVLEDNARLTPGTPPYGVYISYAPEGDALKRGRAGILATKATHMMIGWHCLFADDRDECKEAATQHSLSETDIGSTCRQIMETCSVDQFHSPYRSITGSCNNFNRAHEGESFTAYERLIGPVYADGIENPRRAANKRPLPNARLISGKLTKFSDDKHDRLTMAALQWGQFLEQDLSRPAVTPMFHFNQSFKCCEDDGYNFPQRYLHKFCAPISISNDPFYAKTFKHCMSYVRSLAALRQDCTFGPQEQLNQATHFLDGSQIYGSYYNKSIALRDFKTGGFKTSTFMGKTFLSLSPDPKRDCLKGSTCFVSGDPRVNFEPQMTVMHTLWMREHNRIVRELAALYKNNRLILTLDTEKLFEEARRIVIAEMQHITFDQWAQAILAPADIRFLSSKTDYSGSISSEVASSVAVALFRTFKSMYPNHVSLFSEDRNETRSLNLRDHFYNPEVLRKPQVFDSLVRGLATQTCGKVDMHYAEDLVNHLYTNGDLGYDILALDIQRSRDHGLPSYNKFRETMGGKKASYFKDFKDVMDPEEYGAISKIYTNPDDVDLIIGGMMERPQPGSVFGPTLSWLLVNQLANTRMGDRYFYTNTEILSYPFTSSQQKEVNKVTLSGILCDNADDVKMMQMNVFEKISESNPLVSCDDIPRINLTVWLHLE